jgi:hypothetical protein
LGVAVKMDRQSAFSVHAYSTNFEQGEDSNVQVQEQLLQFILDFRLENKFVYRYGRLPRSQGTAAGLEARR